MKAIFKNSKVLRHNKKGEIKASKAKAIQLPGVLPGKDC